MNLKGKNVIVLGLGISGMAALKLCCRKGAMAYCVGKGEPTSWPDFSKADRLIPPSRMADQDSDDAFEWLGNCDILVKSPGVPWTIPFLIEAKKQNVRIISEIELASRFITAPIIAVTGTNGKTTTVTMLEKSFEAAGVDAFVGGNIGTPPCELVLSEKNVEAVILELSSFQLETMEEFHPEAAAILNLAPSHGERYDDPAEYARAKFHIADKMTDEDVLFLRPDIPYICDWRGELISRSNYVNDKLLAGYSLEDFKLPGKHNIENVIFTIALCEEFGRRHDCLKKMQKGVQEMIDTFTGVPHRLEFVESKSGHFIYNDAKSTNWDATLTAVRAMAGERKPLILILGGQLRGNNDLPSEKVAAELSEAVDHFLFIGESAELLMQSMSRGNSCTNVGTLEAAKVKAYELVEDGTILFSPAYPSFDQFKNYADRGETFKRIFR